MEETSRISKMVVQKKVEVKPGSHLHLQKFQQPVVDFHPVAKRPKVALSSEMEERKKEKESDEEESDDSESESDDESLDEMMDTEDGNLEKAKGW